MIENGICTATSTHSRMDRPAHAIIGRLRHTLQRCSSSSYLTSHAPRRPRLRQTCSSTTGATRTLMEPRSCSTSNPIPPPPARALWAQATRAQLRASRAGRCAPQKWLTRRPCGRLFDPWAPSGKIKTNTFRTIESSAHFSCLWQRRSCSRPIREKEQREGAAPLRIQQQQLFGEIQRR